MRCASGAEEGCIQASHQTLSARFLIAGRAINLTREKQTRDFPHFQRKGKFARIDMVIFNCVSRLKNGHVFQSWDRLNEGLLNVLRQ